MNVHEAAPMQKMRPRLSRGGEGPRGMLAVGTHASKVDGQRP
jgi:hypothetical protein